MPLPPGGVLQVGDPGLRYDADLRTLFQPVIDLRSGTVAGFEALTRGPHGHPLEQPDELFASARQDGRLAELDWSCRCLAFRTAAHRLLPPQRLLVNVEPEVLGSTCPADLLPDWVLAQRTLRVVVEITERCLLDRPADLLRACTTMRELGWEIALDDVGANDAGVALLPVVRPEIVKLDRSLLVAQPDRAQRAVLEAVRAYVRRSGAHIVAEGIETDAQRALAVELGADWGQGFLLGRPETLQAPAVQTSRRPRRRPLPFAEDAVDPQLGTLPFRPTVDRLGQVLLSPGELDDRIRQVLTVAEGAPDSTLVVAAVGDSRARAGDLTAQLARLAGVCALVAVLGTGLPAWFPAGVRATHLPAGDPLATELAIAVLGPGGATALVSRAAGDVHVCLVTEDRDEVALIARALLARAAPAQNQECFGG